MSLLSEAWLSAEGHYLPAKAGAKVHQAAAPAQAAGCAQHVHDSQLVGEADGAVHPHGALTSHDGPLQLQRMHRGHMQAWHVTYELCQMVVHLTLTRTPLVPAARRHPAYQAVQAVTQCVPGPQMTTGSGSVLPPKDAVSVGVVLLSSRAPPINTPEPQPSTRSCRPAYLSTAVRVLHLPRSDLGDCC